MNTSNASIQDWVSFVHLLLASIPTWKLDVTITKLGWTIYMMPFSKMPTSEEKLRFRL